MDYKSAGVDIKAGEEAVARIKVIVQQTFSANVLTGIGQFGGLFRFDNPGMTSPVLVSSADGVGTKLKLAFMMDKHDTIGQDLVNHCVNDILVMGARPLFFLDYIATGKLSPCVIAEIVKGLAVGCRENGCALIGGETAEMPDFYASGEYDVAGFIVGLVDQPKIIDGRRIRPGDVILGLESSGLHTNGYTLARAICFRQAGLAADDYIDELGQTIGEALLTPHRSYANLILPILDKIEVKGMAHITGGGLPGNVIRILPEDCTALIERDRWTPAPIFSFLQREGRVDWDEMYNAFNMGIGLVIIAAEEDVDHLCSLLPGVHVVSLGRIEKGSKEVKLV